MDHFRIGELQVSRIEEQVVHFDAREFYPDIRADVVAQHAAWLAPFLDIPAFRMPCVFQSFLVRYRGLAILIDTCIGNDKERPDFPIAHRLNTPYLERLRAAGCAPDDVAVVLCTHMHVDHVGWNTRLENGRWVPTFPNATYVFSKEEYARYAPDALNPDAPPPFFNIYQDSVLPVIEAGQALIVSGEHAVNEVLTVVPAPGHTPGHVAVRAREGGQHGLFLGDVIHNQVQMADPNLNSAYCEDPATARATRHRLLAEAVEHHSLLVPGHFVAPHVGHVERHGDAYRFLPLR